MNKVIIFSPSIYSLYTTTIVELLLKKELTIQAIYVRKLINPTRFFSEIKRDGMRLFQKIWKKLILRQKAFSSHNVENLLTLRKEQNLSFTNARQFKTKFGIPVISCKTLNEPVVVEGLQAHQPDLVVFTGGGLIRQHILDKAGRGVVNCHMGILPQFRGMDVVEWSLLLGLPDQVGITVHIMDKGVDTGDILRVQSIPPSPGETISGLRNRMEARMCSLMVETVIDYLNGKLDRQPQLLEQGKQYYKMHPRLLKLIKN